MSQVESADKSAVTGADANAWQTVLDKLDGLYDAASQEVVFAPPVSAEDKTVIAAAEVLLGVGLGGGGESSAGGGGGGGMAHSRPVAVIVIDRDGVRVEPVIDVTKLALAGITAFGSMLFMLSRMRRGRN